MLFVIHHKTASLSGSFVWDSPRSDSHEWGKTANLSLCFSLSWQKWNFGLGKQGQGWFERSLHRTQMCVMMCVSIDAPVCAVNYVWLSACGIICYKTPFIYLKPQTVKEKKIIVSIWNLFSLPQFALPSLNTNTRSHTHTCTEQLPFCENMQICPTNN